MFKKRIKKSRATWLGLLLRKGNSRSKLRQQHSERGIAIPLVIGIGLLMMLLSITVIVRSQSSQINTSNLKQAATASEVAETGLARIQEIFQLNPWIATVPLTTPSPTWKDLTQWKTGVTSSSSCPPTRASTVLDGMIPDGNGWFDIETGKRQFRVVSYTTTGTPANPTPTTGTLKLEGKIINGIGGPVLSTSALQVTIPVNPGDIKNIPIPGLWISTSWGTPGNNNKANDGLIVGDVIVRCTPTGGTAPAPKNPNHTTIESNLQLPALPDFPTSPPAISLSSVPSVLPRLADLPAIPDTISKTWGSLPKTYQYIVGDLTDVTIDPNYKVSIYMRGNISKTTNVYHDTSTATTTVTNAANSSGSCGTGTQCEAFYKASDFRIFGYGPNPATSAIPEICVNGNRTVEGFILAPSYAIGRTGTSAFKGTIFAGGYMMDSISCASANGALVVTQTGTWDDLAGFAPQNLPPYLSASQTWTKMQAQ